MSIAKPKLSPQEYLALERRAERKSEYFAGEMFAMAGATEAHNLVSTNATVGLHNRLKGRPCKTYSSDMRVKVDPSGLYTYPDVSIVCGPAHFEDQRRDTLLNPNVIVEVLSPSTEAYDRGEKFAHYRKLDSLTDYILVAQDKPRIEHFVRQADGHWLLSEAEGLAATLTVASLDCVLPLADIYDKVDFTTAESTPVPASKL